MGIWYRNSPLHRKKLSPKVDCIHLTAKLTPKLWNKLVSITTNEMQGWMKHKLESRLPGEINNNLRYADDTTLMAESKEELKSLLMKVKEES